MKKSNEEKKKNKKIALENNIGRLRDEAAGETRRQNRWQETGELALDLILTYPEHTPREGGGGSRQTTARELRRCDDDDDDYARRKGPKHPRNPKM